MTPHTKCTHHFYLHLITTHHHILAHDTATAQDEVLRHPSSSDHSRTCLCWRQIARLPQLRHQLHSTHVSDTKYVPPLMHRLLLWDCPQECDYRCQQIITFARLNQGQEIVQFHGNGRFFGFSESRSWRRWSFLWPTLCLITEVG